jgi:cytochrome P450
MTVYPEVQRRAQAEIDRVIGSDRLPTLADQPSLPYVDALVKEVLRWNPVAPLGKPTGFPPRLFRNRLTAGVPPGVAHVPAEDDFYEGYLIPKGSSVIANIW